MWLTIPPKLLVLVQHFSLTPTYAPPSFRYIGKTDSITISVWNHKKIHKKQGAGFLGCVRLLSNAISRLKDTGCMYPLQPWTQRFNLALVHHSYSDTLAIWKMV